MTMLKASALTLGLAGAFALGVWTGPEVRESAGMTPRVERSAASGTSAPRPAPATARDATPVRAAETVAASAATVRAHVKPLLNQGTNLERASTGFRDAEQFVAVAHAARNTEIPFVLLKHRVLNEGKTLSAAIRESKTDLNATLEAERARAEARADLARLRG